MQTGLLLRFARVVNRITEPDKQSSDVLKWVSGQICPPFQSSSVVIGAQKKLFASGTGMTDIDSGVHSSVGYGPG